MNREQIAKGCRSFLYGLNFGTGALSAAGFFAFVLMRVGVLVTTNCYALAEASGNTTNNEAPESDGNATDVALMTPSSCDAPTWLFPAMLSAAVLLLLTIVVYIHKLWKDGPKLRSEIYHAKFDEMRTSAHTPGPELQV